MKYLILISLLFLAGCEISVDGDDGKSALVNITCYDINGNITVRTPHYRGTLRIVDDPSKGYKSQKCIIERVE